MRLFLLFSIGFFLPLLVFAQENCTSFLPGQGTKLTYFNYDKKGKKTSTTTNEIVSVKTKGDTIYFKVHQLITTGKKKDDMENDLLFKCSGNNFIIDMNSILNSEQMKAYEDATLSVKSKDMFIPGDLKPGMELNDGSITITAFLNPMTTTITARVFYREVVDKEDITTPAGTFSAWKITGNVESKFAFMRIAYRTVEWYVKNIGVVRSESYDRKGKMIGHTELQSIK